MADNDAAHPPVPATGETAEQSRLAELQRSEAEYRSLFNTIESGFCIVEVNLGDTQGRIDYRVIEANPAFYEETGFPRSIFDKWLREAAPTLEEHWFQTYGRVARTGQSEHFEQGSDLLGRWFDVHAFRTSGDETNRVAILFNDISARKAAENQLRHLNETLEAQVLARSAERDRLWNLSQDMFARADFTGMMSAVSPAWTRILGWSEAELLSRGYSTFMHAEDEPSTLAAIGEMNQTGRPSRFQNRIAASDGSWKHIEWTVAPEPDGINFIAVGRDMTGEKKREHELLQAQEQLRQSQKLEAMGQLTGGVAHDFNNLLTPIIGTLDLLVRRGIGNDRERRGIEGALQSAERAKVLVQRLLAFARRQPLQPTPVDVGALVRGLDGLIESTLGPTIDIRMTLAEDLPLAMADTNQLEMALLNLAVNSRDAMPEGGELTIETSSKTFAASAPSGLAPGHYVHLRVADTGIGMDQATLHRAIEPFFSTKGIGRGTGLGLSMVHGLAAQLGGALTIESTPGAGTAVSLWFPATSEPGAHAEQPPSLPEGLGRGTVLLVDDEPLVRMSAADMLIDLGLDVVEAASGQEALVRLASGTTFDLLVTDHLMPGMSGVELARKARVTHPALPVLIISGYAEVELIATDIPRLTKPFRKAELGEMVMALMPKS